MTKKIAQVRLSKRSGHRHIGGIRARRHQHTANPQFIVARIEGPPAPA
jgi:hypothetical protein